MRAGVTSAGWVTSRPRITIGTPARNTASAACGSTKVLNLAAGVTLPSPIAPPQARSRDRQPDRATASPIAPPPRRSRGSAAPISGGLRIAIATSVSGPIGAERDRPGRPSAEDVESASDRVAAGERRAGFRQWIAVEAGGSVHGVGDHRERRPGVGDHRRPRQRPRAAGVDRGARPACQLQDLAGVPLAAASGASPVIAMTKSSGSAGAPSASNSASASSWPASRPMTIGQGAKPPRCDTVSADREITRMTMRRPG